MVDEAPSGALDPTSSNYLFHSESAAAKGKTTARQDETIQQQHLGSEYRRPDETIQQRRAEGEHHPNETLPRRPLEEEYRRPDDPIPPQYTEGEFHSPPPQS